LNAQIIPKEFINNTLHPLAILSFFINNKIVHMLKIYHRSIAGQNSLGRIL